MVPIGDTLREVRPDSVAVERGTQLLGERHEDGDRHLAHHAALTVAQQGQVVHPRLLRRDQLGAIEGHRGAGERVAASPHPGISESARIAINLERIFNTLARQYDAKLHFPARPERVRAWRRTQRLDDREVLKGRVENRIGRFLKFDDRESGGNKCEDREPTGTAAVNRGAGGAAIAGHQLRLQRARHPRASMWANGPCARVARYTPPPPARSG